jgi:hypothetical protein
MENNFLNQLKRLSTICIQSFHHSNEKPFALYTWEGPLPSLIFWPTPLGNCQATTLKLGERHFGATSPLHTKYYKMHFLSFVFESTSSPPTMKSEMI